MPPAITTAGSNAVLRVEAVACPVLRTQAVVPFHDIVYAKRIGPVYDDAAAVLNAWHLHAGILRKALGIIGVDISAGLLLWFSIIVAGA